MLFQAKYFMASVRSHEAKYLNPLRAVLPARPKLTCERVVNLVSNIDNCIVQLLPRDITSSAGLGNYKHIGLGVAPGRLTILSI